MVILTLLISIHSVLIWHTIRKDMTRWSKDALEFPVGLHYGENGRGCMAVIPKPILERLGKPEGITFSVRRGNIVVTASNRKKTKVVPK